ncbi:MAG: hypothetical protein NVSMB49_27380 [Ktedonobacteraceae bacterium]
MQRVSIREVDSAPHTSTTERQDERKAALFQYAEFLTFVKPYDASGETTPGVRSDARREPQ